jgi:hypothetical protein
MNLLPLSIAIQAARSREEALSSIENICRELDLSGDHPIIHNKTSFWKTLTEAFDENFSELFGGGMASSFSNLQGGPEERAYMARLMEIKRNRNRIERIRDAYALAVANQGDYDRKTEGVDSDWAALFLREQMPSHVLAQARRTGSGGVCRHFAALLKWSLNQVARPTGENSSALGEDSFSAEVINGFSGRDEHAWVRVNLGYQTANGLEFHSVDLDPTWNKETFSPLLPRLMGESHDYIKAAHKSCLATQFCVRRYTN